MEQSVKPLYSYIDPSWNDVLLPLKPLIDRLDFELTQASGEDSFLPHRKNIFKAFTYPFDEVKVVIIGQDPYPTPGHAMGLSFSVNPGCPLPKSLKNIYAELESDLGIKPSQSGDLRPWCEQGVMLLNRVLTVGPHAPGSHRNKGWEQVSHQALTALVKRDKPLVAVLWGADARSLKPLLGSSAIVESPHPSPLSAYRGFFGSKPFSRINELLKEQGAEPIDWRLPE